MADTDFQLEYWRLFHSLIRHGSQPEEMDRAEAVVVWMGDNSVTVRRCCVGDELDLIGVVYAYAAANKTLPTLNAVNDELDKMDKTEPMVTALDDYKDLRSGLTVYDSAALGQVLTDKVAAFERDRLHFFLRTAVVINGGQKREDKQLGRTYLGPRGAINYLMDRMEQGILINQTGVVRPIVVQQEAHEIGSRYDYLRFRGHLDTGIGALRLQPGNFLGLLGYLGGGKTTLARFICYQLALSGKQILHVSLEEPSETELYKYVLLHCHNPKWRGQFDGIGYEKFLHGRLSAVERRALDVVAEDFEKTVAGRITILQPQEASWESVRQLVEMHSERHQLDILFIDYLALMEPKAARSEDGRARMTTMIKQVRQFGLTHQTQSGEPMVIVTPIQANEEGRKQADNNDGIWGAWGINDHKELGRSCDQIWGTFTYGNHDVQGRLEGILSCVKNRDGIYSPPVNYRQTSAGWIQTDPVSFPDAVTTDDLVDEAFA